MATILRMDGRRPAPVRGGLREMRKEYELSLAEAGEALGVAASTVENWERVGSPRRPPESVRASFEEYRARSPSTAGKNLLFGCYPLRLARQLLKADVQGIASMFGYSPSAWLKFEADARPLPQEKLAALEERVRRRVTEVCRC